MSNNIPKPPEGYRLAEIGEKRLQGYIWFDSFDGWKKDEGSYHIGSVVEYNSVGRIANPIKELKMKTDDELREELKQAKQLIEKVEKEFEERKKAKEEEPLWKQMGLPREPKKGELVEVWDCDKKPEFPRIRRFDSIHKMGGIIQVSCRNESCGHDNVSWLCCALLEQNITPKLGLWVARDKGRRLFAYEHHPFRDTICWSNTESSSIIELSANLFPNLKWEDEPLEI